MVLNWHRLATRTHSRRARRHAAGATEQLEERQLLAATIFQNAADNHLTNFQNQRANLGGSSELQFYKAGDNLYRPLVQFDVSDIAPGETIGSAQLELWHADGLYANSDMDVTVYALATPWDEGSDTNHSGTSAHGSSWLNAAGGTAWTTPGGDFVTNRNFGNGANGIVAQTTIPGFTTEQWMRIDVTSVVDAWVNDGLANHGLAFEITSGDHTEHVFVSADSGDSAHHPRLIVDTDAAPSPGRLSLETSQVTLDEDHGTLTLNVVRTNGRDGEVTVQYQTVDGTAASPGDYAHSAGTLTFADGETSKSITVQIADDSVEEAAEAFTVRLSAPTGGVAIDTAITTVTISANDVPPGATIVLQNAADNHLTNLQNPEANLGGLGELQFFKAGDAMYRPLMQFDLSEVDPATAVTTATASLYRTSGLYANAEMQVTVYAMSREWTEGTGFDQYAVTSGSDWLNARDGVRWSTPGGDFDLTTDFGHGPNGIVSQTAIAPFTTAGWVDFDVTGAVEAWLSGTVNNYGLGFVITAGDHSEYTFAASEHSNTALHPTLTIETSDSQPASGEFSFATTQYNVNEADPSIQVEVRRLNGTDGVVSVDYRTGDITTTQLEDYVPVVGTLTFGDGQDSMLITVPIIQDSYAEDDETFALQLLNPTGGATVGADTAVVTILDDDTVDPPGLLRFGQPMYMVSETAGYVTVAIVRDGGSSGAVTVDYRTEDDGAVAGEDYTAVTGTLSFADGETEKTVLVPILDDGSGEEDERFWMYLSNPTGGANVVVSGAQLIIKDNEPRPGSGDGLYGEYYDNIDFTGLEVVRVDSQINFNWGSGSPSENVAADTFSVVWTGRVEPIHSEQYTFSTTSDDGVRLWVDGQLIIDNWTDHAPTTDTGVISLTGGQLYDIRMEYYERGGGAVAQLEWSSPSQAQQIVPQSQLYSDKDRYQYNGHAYALTGEKMAWTEASTLARQLGGNLVTINTAAEEAWLKSTFGEDQEFWTGLNDVDSEGSFEWVSGEAVTYTNWHPGEPNNGGGNQDYVWMNFGTPKQWDDNGPAAIAFGIIEFTDDTVPSQNAVFGDWGAPIAFPNIAVAAAAVPNGNIVTWSSWDRFNFGGNNPQSYTSVFNTETQQVEEFLITNTQHDMFCPGTVMLPDGKIMVNGGGSTVTSTSVYDFATNTWTRVENMNMRRWYNSSTTLGDGRVITWGGNAPDGHAGPAEVWEEGNGWTNLPNMNINIYAGTGDQTSWHPQMFQAPNGKLFIAGPGPNMYWADLRGTPASTVLEPAGSRGTDGYSQHGAYVMYDVGKILKFGGADAEANSGTVTNRAWIIDITGNTPVVTETGSMNFFRKFLNGVVLPDGRVMAVGGNTSGNKFSDAGSVLRGEIWDPQTGEWSVVDSMAIPRNYHAVALLQPDGRVFAGGGGLCGTCAANHSDAQVYSPGYLFDQSGNQADRPVVTGAGAANYGSSLTVSVAGGHTVEKFSLIRMSTVTHSMNTDQRYLPATFTDLGNGDYSVDMPGSGDIAPPGHYMLFGINDAGVPGKAHVVQIGNNVAAAGEPSDATPNDTPEQSVSAGAGIVVAVIDTGVDANHFDLRNNLWQNTGEVPGDGIDNDGNGYIDDTHGFDFVQPGSSPTDPNGHGTAMAGIIAASNNGLGTTGIAPYAQIVSLRTLDVTGNGSGVRLAEAIRYAVDNGAHVINLSLTSNEDPAVEAAIAYASEHNVFVSVSAGTESASFLAALSTRYDNVVSVGAIYNGQVQSDSGASLIDATGVAETTQPNDAIGTWAGESVASANVAGAAAAVLAANPGLTAPQVRQLLMHSADAAVPGSASLGTLNTSNAVRLAMQALSLRFELKGDKYFVTASAGDDAIAVDSTTRQLTINGVRYPVPANAEILVLSGGGGADELSVSGTSAKDKGLLRASVVRLDTPSFSTVGRNFESVSLDAGADGTDTLRILDTPSDDAVLVSGSESTLITATRSLRGLGFDTVEATASGGTDRVMIVGGSGANTILADAGRTEVIGSGDKLLAHDFEFVSILGGDGENDATVVGTSDADRLVLAPHTAVLNSENFEVRLNSVENILVKGGRGSDTASISDSAGRDEVTYRPRSVTISGEGYSHRIQNFEFARIGSTGGSDLAKLYGSKADELFVGRPETSEFSGPGYSVVVDDFRDVRAFGEGGTDLADVYGSNGNDSLFASPSKTRLKGERYAIATLNFDRNRIYGRGGNDTAEFHDSSRSDKFIAKKNSVRMIAANKRYNNYAVGFETVAAHSTHGGRDKLFAETDLDYAFRHYGDWEIL